MRIGNSKYRRPSHGSINNNPTRPCGTNTNKNANSQCKHANYYHTLCVCRSIVVLVVALSRSNDETCFCPCRWHGSPLAAPLLCLHLATRNSNASGQTRDEKHTKSYGPTEHDLFLSFSNRLLSFLLASASAWSCFPQRPSPSPPGKDRPVPVGRDQFNVLGIGPPIRMYRNTFHGLQSLCNNVRCCLEPCGPGQE